MDRMIQLTGKGANASEPLDDVLVGHAPVYTRTVQQVNVESVHLALNNVGMIDGRTNGEILKGLMERSGLSVRTFANAAGYAHGSGVQRYIDPVFDAPLKPDVAKRMADALEGKGSPPITRNEILVLTGMEGTFEVEPNSELPTRYHDLPRDVPVYGTALGTFTDNEVIEQTIISTDDPIDILLRPPGLAQRKGIYGLYVTGESQSPRFKPGEIVFADPARAPMIGDDVIVYLAMERDGEEAIAAILIKELTRRGPTKIELRQLNPFAEFSVDNSRVKAIHRVLTNTDMFGGYR